jgi:hypothetical protein
LILRNQAQGGTKMTNIKPHIRAEVARMIADLAERLDHGVITQGERDRKAAKVIQWAERASQPTRLRSNGSLPRRIRR